MRPRRERGGRGNRSPRAAGARRRHLPGSRRTRNMVLVDGRQLLEGAAGGGHEPHLGAKRHQPQLHPGRGGFLGPQRRGALRAAHAAGHGPGRGPSSPPGRGRRWCGWRGARPRKPQEHQQADGQHLPPAAHSARSGSSREGGATGIGGRTPHSSRFAEGSEGGGRRLSRSAAGPRVHQLHYFRVLSSHAGLRSGVTPHSPKEADGLEGRLPAVELGGSWAPRRTSAGAGCGPRSGPQLGIDRLRRGTSRPFGQEMLPMEQR